MAGPAGGQVLSEGHNCWRIVPARRVGVMVDGCAYFSALACALRKAERSIMIVGWDFDGRIRLLPQRPDGEEAELGPLLRHLVETREELHIRILVWSVAVVHGPSATSELLIGDTWQHHPRISLHLDTTHPLYASHHQKIVVIDDALAFVGGMDLTVDRWDTPDHRPADDRRRLPEGDVFAPVHDLMLMLDGEAARSCAEVARERWRQGVGEPVAPAETAPDDLWPAGHAPQFEDEPLGLARSMPAWQGRERVAEAPNLTRDLLKAARRSLYIEAQYLSAAYVADILEQRLAEPDGPEVIIVVSLMAHSMLERLVMGANRDRLIRRLSRADRHGRLRIYHPCATSSGDGCPILVHSKLIIADDRILRIGSSNLNNRSVGLDSEFDLAVEAKGNRGRAAIAAVRDSLLGEHMGVSAETVAQTRQKTGSLRRAIEQLNQGERHLRLSKAMHSPGPTRPVVLTSLLDPPRPFTFPSWRWLRRLAGQTLRVDGADAPR